MRTDADDMTILFERSTNGATDEERAALFTQLAAQLAARMDMEEASVLPAVQRHSERDARVLVQEHRFLRRMLAEIAERPTAEAIRTLRDIVQAHDRNEARIARQWLGRRD